MRLSGSSRFAVYRLSAAVLGLLAALNVIDAEMVPLWSEVVAALFGVAASMLASFNVSED
jgi:hypothetical protein